MKTVTQNSPLTHDRTLALIEAVSMKDTRAREALYLAIRPGLSFLMARHRGTVPSQSHLLAVFTLIEGLIVDRHITAPSDLYSAARRIVRSQVEDELNRRGCGAGDVFKSERSDIETRQESLESERCAGFMAGLPDRHRQAMKRFYLDREPAETICADSALSMAEFISIKTLIKNSLMPSKKSSFRVRPGLAPTPPHFFRKVS